MLEQAIKSIECKAAYTFLSLLVRLNECYDVQQGQDVVSGGVYLFEDGGILIAEDRRQRQLESMLQGLASYIGNTRMNSHAQNADGPDAGFRNEADELDGMGGFGFTDSGWSRMWICLSNLLRTIRWDFTTGNSKFMILIN
jgi:hypothetical protein